MKRFKRIYIEITNCCNLHCSFCAPSKRVKQVMSVDQFKGIIKQIAPYTDTIYLHVKGEPLLHPQIEQLLQICQQECLQVNITTNGTLLKDNQQLLINSDCVKKINISLHCEQENTNYYEQVFEVGTSLSTKMVIIYRLWTLKEGTLDKKSTEIVEKMRRYYQLSTDTVHKLYKEKNIKLREHLYVDKSDLFDWPSLSNDYCEEYGYCYGLKTHLAILVDGSVVPCCLDGEGEMKLGNLYQESFESILTKEQTIKIIKGFQNRKAVEALCRHCSYKRRFERDKQCV